MENHESKQVTVLVVGASGFVGSHCIKQLLSLDYKVRGTVRKLSNTSKYNFLYDLVPSKKDNLEIVEADLVHKEIWPSVVSGCDYVLHIAFPFVLELLDSEPELSQASVMGVMNVLEAAFEAGVKKFVLASTFTTMEIGNENKVIDANCWADEKKCNPYVISKMKAEKAALEFWRQHKDKIQVTIINSSHIFGPEFQKGVGADCEDMIVSFMTNQWSVIPEVCWAVVDVRDVAEALIKAMTNPYSDGKRYIVSSSSIWLRDIFGILKAEFEMYGYEFPETEIGKYLMTIASFWNQKLKSQLSESFTELKVDNTPSIDELGIQYRRPEDFLLESVYNLIDLGVIPNRIHNPEIDKLVYDEKVHFDY